LVYLQKEPTTGITFGTVLFLGHIFGDWGKGIVEKDVGPSGGLTKSYLNIFGTLLETPTDRKERYRKTLT